MERFEIRNDKGKLIESELKGTEIEAIERVKELAKDGKTNYELVKVSTVYDTANPPVVIEF